ncbi:MAG: hypothetical protein AB7G75_23515 [Candidatus Binatia bacterium]
MKNSYRTILFLIVLMVCRPAQRGQAQDTIQDPLPPPLAKPPASAEDWQYPIVEPTLTCEQANRVAHKSIARLGYKVTAFTPATSEKEGEVKAARPGLWGGEEAVRVTLACKPDGVQINAFPEVPPCEQGNRISRLAIERRGYKISEFTPAAIGKPGIVKGTQDGHEPVMITIACLPNQNVVMETSMDSPVPRHKDFFTGISNFYQGFYAVFKGERGMTVPENIPMSDNQVHVALKPLSDVDMKIAFGTELKQLLPVLVEIANRTKRAYVFEIEQVMLLSAAGKRVKPAAAKADSVPAPSLINQTIAPGTSVKGYLYYPAGTYTGARGTLTEEQSHEREGFDVQF